MLTFSHRMRIVSHTIVISTGILDAVHRVNDADLAILRQSHNIHFYEYFNLLHVCTAQYAIFNFHL